MAFRILVLFGTMPTDANRPRFRDRFFGFGLGFVPLRHQMRDPLQGVSDSFQRPRNGRLFVAHLALLLVLCPTSTAYLLKASNMISP
jgi:hypothetical protein